GALAVRVDDVARIGHDRVAPGAAVDFGYAAVAQLEAVRAGAALHLLDVGLDRVAFAGRAARAGLSDRDGDPRAARQQRSVGRDAVDIADEVRAGAAAEHVVAGAALDPRRQVGAHAHVASEQPDRDVDLRDARVSARDLVAADARAAAGAGGHAARVLVEHEHPVGVVDRHVAR